MKTPLSRALALTMIWTLTFGPGLALADPCGMVTPFPLTPGAPELTRVGDQITYVFFKDGVEDLVLRPAFEGSVTQFGMLIPFPSPPEIRKVPDTIFTHLKKVVDPPEIVIDLRPRPEMEFAGRSFKRMLRADRDQLWHGRVTVLKEEAVGMYQVAVLEASDPRALEAWMVAHGYVYPTGMDAVCAEYIQQKWCFTAVKANVGNKGAVTPRPGMREADAKLPAGSNFGGAVQAMGFRFRVAEPVVPMRLSAFNAGELHNIVYVLSDRPCRFAQLDESFVQRQLPGEVVYRNITAPLPVKVLGGTLEEAKQAGYLSLPAYDRNPVPHNGHARDLFAADLLAVRENRLAHDFESYEKELLRIGERLGLRGPEVDERIQEIVAADMEKATGDVLEALRGMTLTVIDGNFPREILAKENLTFAAHVAPPTDEKSEQGSVVPAAKKFAEAPRSSSPLTALITLGLLLGASIVGFRRGGALVLLLAVAVASPAGAITPPGEPVPLLIDMLSQPSEAETAAAALIAMGSKAVPDLVGEAVEGQDLARRGWSLVCLSDIGDRGAEAPIRRLMDDESAPRLIRLWAGASLTRLRGAEGIRELIREQIESPARQPAVAAVLLGMQGSAVRPLVTLTLQGETTSERQVAAAYLGSLDGRLRGGVVRRVLEENLRYQTGHALPWAGGPLFLPGYQWSPDEAFRLTTDLVSWLSWAEKNEETAVAQQVRNNLRDLSWRNGLGFQQLPTAADWTRALLVHRGLDGEAVTKTTPHETLVVLLALMRK